MIITIITAHTLSLIPTVDLIEFDDHNKASTLSNLGVTDSNNLKYFPYIPVGELNYSPHLVGLLSQLASYSLYAHKEDILSFFEK